MTNNEISITLNILSSEKLLQGRVLLQKVRLQRLRELSFMSQLSKTRKPLAISVVVVVILCGK